MHNIVMKNGLIEKGTGIPAVDNVAYGQEVDMEKDAAEAEDDPRIPDELKDLMARMGDAADEPEAPDAIGDFLTELGRKAGGKC